MIKCCEGVGMLFNSFVIFGGCGFIGTHMANLLREKYPDAKIYIADLVADASKLPEHTQFVVTDITDCRTLNGRDPRDDVD